MLTNHSRNEADLVKIAGKNVNISHLMPAQDRTVLVMFKASPSPSHVGTAQLVILALISAITPVARRAGETSNGVLLKSKAQSTH